MSQATVVFLFNVSLKSLSQALSLVEKPAFRAVLLTLRQELKDSDIPLRGTIRKAILKRWEEAFEAIVKDMSVSQASRLLLFKLY